MNCNFGIQIQNDIAAARGKSLTWDKAASRLKLNGEPIGPQFLNRKGAQRWAQDAGAYVRAV